MLFWGRVGDDARSMISVWNVRTRAALTVSSPVRCAGPVVFLCQQCQCVSSVCWLYARLCWACREVWC